MQLHTQLASQLHKGSKYLLFEKSILRIFRKKSKQRFVSNFEKLSFGYLLLMNFFTGHPPASNPRNGCYTTFQNEPFAASSCLFSSFQLTCIEVCKGIFKNWPAMENFAHHESHIVNLTCNFLQPFRINVENFLHVYLSVYTILQYWSRGR